MNSNDPSETALTRFGRIEEWEKVRISEALKDSDGNKTRLPEDTARGQRPHERRAERVSAKLLSCSFRHAIDPRLRPYSPNHIRSRSDAPTGRLLAVRGLLVPDVHVRNLIVRWKCIGGCQIIAGLRLLGLHKGLWASGAVARRSF
jgi:hypothetical protein